MENNTELLNEKLTELLIWIEEGVKTSKDFVAEQAPLYIQELLAWNFWISLIYWCISLALLYLPIYTIIRLLRGKFTWKDEDCTKEPILIFGGLIFLFIGAPTFFNNLDWFQITVAPRVWLVEYLQKML